MARVEELGKALCEVRKAHRIIYAYQKRMMDLARFIGAKLDMPECQVIKHYSNSPSKKISAGTWEGTEKDMTLSPSESLI